jgi:hypothetical protein
MVEKSQSYRNLPFECLVKLAMLQGVSTTRVSLKNTLQEAQQVRNVQIKILTFYNFIYFNLCPQAIIL